MQTSEAKIRAVEEKYDTIKALSITLQRQVISMARERDEFKARCERAEARFELQRKRAQHRSAE